MSLPILIPANNEAAEIGATLESLPSDVDPIVLANGCTDDTASIARGFGARVEVLEEPSKVRALQHGLNIIGREAMSGWVILDADTHIMSKNYVAGVNEHLGLSKDAVIVAPQLYRGDRLGNVTAWSFISCLNKALRVATNPNFLPTHGSNMMMRSSNDTIESLLELDDYWPGEDVAIRNEHRDRGAAMVRTMDKRLWASTSVRGMPSVAHRVVKGRAGYANMRNELWWSLRPVDGKAQYEHQDEDPAIGAIGPSKDASVLPFKEQITTTG